MARKPPQIRQTGRCAAQHPGNRAAGPGGPTADVGKRRGLCRPAGWQRRCGGRQRRCGGCRRLAGTAGTPADGVDGGSGGRRRCLAGLGRVAGPGGLNIGQRKQPGAVDRAGGRSKIYRQSGLRRLPRCRAPGLADIAACAGDAARQPNHRAGQLQQRQFQPGRGSIPLHHPGRPVFCAHRRAGRQARRLPGRVHLWGGPAATVPGGAARGPAAGPGHHLGQPAQGRRRSALVSPVPRRETQLHGRVALDKTRAELELHVRRLPFVAGQQGLRCSHRQLRHYLVRDLGGLRVLPRPRLGPSGLGPQQDCRSAQRPDRGPG